jgi:hypothetical protein
LVGSCSAIGQEEPCAVKFIPVSIAVNINSERDFAPIQLEQNSSLIRRRPSATSQSYCAPIPMCRSTSLAAIPGSRVIVRGKPPLQTAKGARGGLKLRGFRVRMQGGEGTNPILGRNAAQGDCCLTFREIGVCRDTVE